MINYVGARTYGVFDVLPRNGFERKREGELTLTAGNLHKGESQPSLEPDYTPVDHDQRGTLNAGFTSNLPFHTWFATNVYYGSGFTSGLAGSGEGPYLGANLPAHTTFDVSAGHLLGEPWQISASMLNVTNQRVLLDNSVTIGGFHYNDPRVILAEVRYRFHF